MLIDLFIATILQAHLRGGGGDFAEFSETNYTLFRWVIDGYHLYFY